MQRFTLVTPLMLMGALLAVAGCGKDGMSTPSDQQIQSDIQAKLSAENALQGQNVNSAVDHGVATLSGIVNTDDARTLAGSDAGAVAGVRTVVNDLALPTEQAASCTPPAPVHYHRHHAKPAPAVMAVQDTEPVPPAPPEASVERAQVQAPPQAAPMPAPVRIVRPAPVVVVAPPPVYYPRPLYYAYGPGIGAWGRPGIWYRPGYRVYGRPYGYGRRY